MSNDKLAATTHGAECVKALDEFRRTSGFLVAPSEYADWDTRAAMTDRALDLDRRQLIFTGLGYVGTLASAANLIGAGLSLTAGHEFWPPLLVGLFLALVTGGLFLLRRAWRLELGIIRTHLKAYYRRSRDSRFHLKDGVVTINPTITITGTPGAGNIVIDGAGRITDRAVAQMAERAIREIQERGL